jgi:hypothetical protein
MNKLIQELAEQAGFYVAGGRIYIPSTSEEITTCQKKFAELIVKECARVARATPFPDTDVEVRKTFGHTWDMASIEAGREIVKHFGVE